MDSHDAQKTFRETLKDALRAKGISANKLAELTDISPRYIRALIENDAENLPAAPYVRGYLHHIAQTLDMDADALWHQYQHDERLDQSGGKDLLPSNRFARTKTNKKAVGLTIIALIAVAYFVPKIASFFGQPSIVLTNPTTDNQNVATSDFFITGRVDNARDKVLINAEEIVVNPDNTFSKEVLLQNGPNTYTIVVHRFLGKDVTLVRTIILATTTPPIETQTSPSTTTPSTTRVPSSSPTALPAGL
jgi:cytoskeletal protein RodZ